MRDIKLNLGCGVKKREGFINIDINHRLKPEIVLDLNSIPYPFKDATVDYIYTAQVIEHLEIHLIDFLKEMHRVLKPVGLY